MENANTVITEASKAHTVVSSPNRPHSGRNSGTRFVNTARSIEEEFAIAMGVVAACVAQRIADQEQIDSVFA